MARDEHVGAVKVRRTVVSLPVNMNGETRLIAADIERLTVGVSRREAESTAKTFRRVDL